MNTMLIIITIASLTIAAIMSAVAWRSVAGERRRSAARVRALAAEIVGFESRSESGAPRFEIDVETDVTTDVTTDLEIRPVATSAGLFAALPASSPRRAPSRATMIAAGMFVVATAAALVVVASGGSRAGSRGAGPSIVAPSAAIAPKPLELLALGHERDGDRLTVRGVVHNPSDAAPVKQLIPVVFVFDHNGGFVTSGRGTVEATTLGPGADSTFVVDVPDVADVGRYRVSFRTDDHVVAHVDRRSETRN